MDRDTFCGRSVRGNRTRRAITVAAALTALLAGCGHPTTASVPEPSGTGPGPRGGTHVAANGVDVRISDAEAHLDRSGSGSLSMTVENSGSVTEHLDMVGTPGGGRGVLSGGSSSGNGALSTAGIQLPPGGRTGFGARNGPRIRLTRSHGVTRAGTLPIVLEFAVVGLVRIQAPVTHG
ncbi:hypothetical protein [Streptomyces sp. TS71-3]|uniref:hypothetical protein n=1 Tax=Streptomyces sp. TS71-3 TaxID=2733862 RepID=UPI001B0CF537|nr:hypothetical protein [Streptomyces sp. TS71-3]GHJ41512.1 hypothetical protein Sm713_71210 [Streptomyces sp. TS71-3]